MSTVVHELSRYTILLNLFSCLHLDQSLQPHTPSNYKEKTPTTFFPATNTISPLSTQPYPRKRFPPPHQTYRSTVAEISRLEACLATAQYLHGVLIPHFNNVKTQHLTQNADIAHFRNQINQAQQQAQALLANNRLADYDQKFTELNRRLAFYIRELEKPGARVEKVAQEVRDWDQEIVRLENLNGLRTSGY